MRLTVSMITMNEERAAKDKTYATAKATELVSLRARLGVAS